MTRYRWLWWLSLVVALGCGGSRLESGRGGEPADAHTATVPQTSVGRGGGEPGGRTYAAERDWRDEILYFVMTDRFFDGDTSNDRDVDKAAKGAFHGGDLAGLVAKLDYLTDLGITALWITPVVEQIDHPVHGAGFPDWGYHGYWAEHFDRVEPRLGTEADLRRLVDEAHRRGIRVLLDVVLNHPGYGSHFAKDPRWCRSTELGTCEETEDPVKMCLLGLPDFRTEDPWVADKLMTWQISWIDRTGCDGFRVDTVKHVEHEVWREFRRRIHQRHPGFFLLGEVWGATMHEAYASEFMGDQMDSLFDFGFDGAVEGFVQGRGRAAAFAHYLETRHRFLPGRMVLAHYLDTHDVPGMLYRLGGDRDKLALAAFIQLVSIGIPVITWGDEVGRVGGEWPDNRSDMPWGDAQDRGLLEKYRALIRFRRAHRALSRGGIQVLYAEGDVVALLRTWEQDLVLVAFNRGTGEAGVSIPMPPGLPGSWADGLSRAAGGVEVTGGTLAITVPPRFGRLLVPSPSPR